MLKARKFNMESEILIFDVPVEETTINKNKKELEYENLIKFSKLDKYHFENFYDDELFFETLKKPSSNMTSIMLKWIIKYFIPIIDEDFSVNEESTTKKRNTKFYITIQNDLITTIFNIHDNKYLSIPKNQSINIIGIRIPKLIFRHYDIFGSNYFDYVRTSDFAKTGKYGLFDLTTRRYTQQRSALPNYGHVKLNSQIANDIIFKDDEHASKIFNVLIEYLVSLENYYQTNQLTLNLSLNKWRDANSQSERIQNERTQSEHMQSEQIQSATLQSAKLNDENVNMLLKLNNFKIPNNNLLLPFYFNNSNLLYLYNLGKTQGIDDETFKKYYEMYKREKEKELIFYSELRRNYKRDLNVNTKQKIAFEKYGTYDLSKLDNKQLKVIEINFKKNIKTKSQTNNTEINILFNKLQETFSDVDSADLKDILNQIDEKYPEFKKHEDEEELISKHGVCPHIYDYAKVYLKYFNSDAFYETRKVLLEYALPVMTEGYYCRLCGEKILENNIVENNRTSNVEFEDEISSTIWKEAMYALTTYTRMLIPTPIKPIAKSIAKGLRGRISEEELKIRRNKLYTQANIKEIIKLYISVYVYAIIACMILNNPTRIYFGKHKEFKPTRTAATRTRDDADAVRPTESESMDADTVRPTQTLDLSNNKNAITESASTDADAVRPTESASMDADTVRPAQTLDLSNNKYNIPKNSKLFQKENIELMNSESSLSSSSEKKFGSSEYRQLDNIKDDKTQKIRDKLSINIKDMKVYEKQVLSVAINLVIYSKENLIRKIPDLNSDIIKHIFLQNAYTWAKKYIKPIPEITTKEKIKNDIYSIIDIDLFYSYVYYIKSLEYYKTNKNNLDFYDIKYILNNTDQNLNTAFLASESIYKNVKLPNSNNSELTFGDPNYDKYFLESFMNVYEYNNDKIYNYVFCPANYVVKNYYDKIKSTIELEKKIYYFKKKNNVIPTFQIRWLNDITRYNDYRQDKLDLSRHYCLTGEKHKTESYIYTTAAHALNNAQNEQTGQSEKPGQTGKTADRENNAAHYGPHAPPSHAPLKMIELKPKEISNWYKENNLEKIKEFNSYKLYDEKCGRCNKIFRNSRLSEKDLKELKEKFKQIDNIIAFYQYYQDRCPESDLHDIEVVNGVSICKKCKFNTESAKKGNIKINFDDYYNKYKAKFKVCLDEKQFLTIQSLNQTLAYNLQAIKNNKENKKEKVDYKYNLSNISEWSKLTNIKYNVLINIGLSEGVLYDDIEKSKINCSSNTDNYVGRSMKLQNYIYIIIREYNNYIINYDSVVDSNNEIKNIIYKHEKKIERFVKDLKPFEKINLSYKYLLDDKEYDNYLLDFLARMMINLAKSNQYYKELLLELVLYFTYKIISYEKIYAITIKASANNMSDSESDLSGSDISDSESIKQEESEDENTDEVLVANLTNDAYDADIEIDDD